VRDGLRKCPGGSCRYCREVSYLADAAGPVHRCCLAWREVILAGHACPACSAGKAQAANRKAVLPSLPRELPGR